jgi:hypothetical protein
MTRQDLDPTVHPKFLWHDKSQQQDRIGMDAFKTLLEYFPEVLI